VPSALDAEIDAVSQSGFDAMVFSEHHGMKGYVPNPLAAATYVLGRAPGLRAGPMPILLPLHDPVRIAEAAALADALSGGRLVFGVAAGYYARDFEQCGIALETRGQRLEEGTSILRRVWAGDTSPFTGQHVLVPELEPLQQPPAQPGGPRVLMASGTPAGLRRAARVADGIVIDSVRSATNVRELIDRYTLACRELGKDRGEVAVMRRGWLGNDAESETFVRNLAGELGRFASSASGQAMPWFDQPGGGVDMSSVEQRALIGDEEGIDRQLESLEAMGIDRIILKVQWTGGAEPSVLLAQLARWRSLCARWNAER
jgi:alkanesulfonate monooxygenase SsuD/methylene tetrahydromethanopterin reductase-like flavin-dependent oxidoreductase (luciferase family)